jgi:hypothetical protein
MAMTDVPEDEARRILSTPSICPDAIPWGDSRQGLCFIAGAGLLDLEGNPRSLFVELRVSETASLKMKKLIFSVWRPTQWGRHRVYQLDVPCWPKLPKDRHQLPHEHIGGRREIGDASWIRWAYDDVFQHFCCTANVTFQPVPDDPLEFRLKS